MSAENNDRILTYSMRLLIVNCGRNFMDSFGGTVGFMADFLIWRSAKENILRSMLENCSGSPESQL